MPHELTRTLLARARLCAQLAPSARGEADAAFTTGLFSGLDALLDKPLAQLLDELPLADEVRAAVLEHEGPLGRILAAVLALERGDFENSALQALESPPAPGAYLRAVDWANGAMSDLQAA